MQHVVTVTYKWCAVFMKNNLLIADETERIRALDPTKSFIVQAPAGSGKTELITQRVLVLLSRVKQPEEILAITFTRKSAAEMQTRIINALKNAEKKDPPESTHAKKTWELAKKVLHQDALLEWNLLANPSRLRIQTIDSFNAALTRQLPILSHFGAAPDLTNDPFPLYREAVQEFLSHLEENLAWSDAIATILLHLDNDFAKVEELLISLLTRRDQWLPYITLNSNDPVLRQTLESNLANVVSDILTKLKNSLPKNHTEELLFLAQYAKKNLGSENSDWSVISKLLLTKDEWRKRFDKRDGFPTSDEAMKQRMLNLMEQIQDNDTFKNALIEFRSAPEPNYQDNQWKTLEALHQVLRIVVAQLKLTFQQHGKIDYIENAQAALAALGPQGSPTDLTLALDYQISHILLDEFQDTSNSQYRLLEKITAGWETHDGRTLFLVGDPMQSIYRFREAEVGLFIRSRQKGIGHVHLESLTLSVNFRSTPGIVAWANKHFPHVFPDQDDMTSGAVSYSPCQSGQPPMNENSPVTLHSFFNETAETMANAIRDVILKIKKTTPSETIAILVRSRTHLEAILPALKSAQLSWRAVDIEPLAKRQLVQDLMALTRALLHPGDRIAWLAVLRAPWCGLSLSDLLLLSGNNSSSTLLERLENPEVIAFLSKEGQQRLNRVFPLIQNKLKTRRRYSLRNWIESTWLLLGGPACVEQPSDLEDAAVYFKLLDQPEEGGDVSGLDTLTRSTDQLYATSDRQADDTLQIMTVHNAKGLEFDHVIIPHLERQPSHDNKQLLLWMERQREDKSSALILAPVHATGQETDSIYHYIKMQQAIKNEYEKSRLLYVAATRAKKQLHLFFNLKTDEKNSVKPAAGSLLDKLWPAIKNNVMDNQIQLSVSVKKIEKQFSSTLKRLPLDWKNPIQENLKSETITWHQKNPEFKLPDYAPKQTGTLIHQILQQIAHFGADWWLSQPSKKTNLWLTKNYQRLGMTAAALPSAIERVHEAIHHTLNDDRGRWLLSSHQDAQNEFQLTAVMGETAERFIIDRTFIDETGTRWIIDYKTSSCSHDNIKKFLDEEQKKYQEQMQHYYLAMREIEKRPIRMGLYFPLIPAWREIPR